MPLDDDVACDDVDFEPGAVVGHVAAQGTIVDVFVESCDDGAFANHPGLVLAFDSLDWNGRDYKGTVDLDPDDDEAGEVALTVTRTAGGLLPTMALVAGLLVALAVQSYANSRRPVSVLLEQTHLLDGRVGTTAEPGPVALAFATITAGRPFAVDDLATAVRAKTIELRTELKKLRRKNPFAPLDPTTEPLGPFAERLEDVKSAVDSWPTFGRTLVELDDALARVERTGGLGAFVAHQRRTLLAPKAFQTVDVRPAVASASRSLEAARSWSALALLVERAHRVIVEWEAAAAAGNVTADDARLIRRARGKLRQTIQEFDRATTPEELESTRDGALTETTAILDQLGRPPSPKPSAGVAGPVAAMRVPSMAELLAEVARREPTPLEQAEALQLTRQSIDVGLAVLLALVALWAGLVALYIGKPFGGIVDMITAVAWGLGAGAVVTSFADALGRASESLRARN